MDYTRYAIASSDMYNGVGVDLCDEDGLAIDNGGTWLKQDYANNFSTCWEMAIKWLHANGYSMCKSAPSSEFLETNYTATNGKTFIKSESVLKVSNSWCYAIYKK